ncbi:hypothetical protein MUK42_09201, partial [Musa troglodytarum]
MQASTETDGRLNYKEVIENPYVLYTAVMNSIMSFTSYPENMNTVLIDYTDHKVEEHE